MGNDLHGILHDIPWLFFNERIAWRVPWKRQFHCRRRGSSTYLLRTSSPSSACPSQSSRSFPNGFSSDSTRSPWWLIPSSEVKSPQLPIGSMVLVYIANIGGILMGPMLPYIAAPWILWVMAALCPYFTLNIGWDDFHPPIPWMRQGNRVPQPSQWLNKNCLVVWKSFYDFPIYWEFHHSNWLI